MADDETVITLEPETLGEQKTVEADQTITAVEKTAESTDAIDSFKAQYEEAQRVSAQRQADADRERNARLAAEAEARRAREAEAAARGEIADTRLGAIEQGFAAAQAAAEAAESEYVSAQEAGDWKRAAQAQRKLARAEAETVEFNRAKTELEINKTEQVARTEAPQRQQQQVAADPVEAFIASRTGPTQTWLRAHSDHARAMARFVVGQATPEEAKIARKLSAASSDAEAEGYAIDSAEYFSHVENFVGLKKQAEQTQQRQPGNGQQQPRRRSVPAAPVNGGSSAGGGGGGGAVEVRLAPHEAAAAKDGTHVWLESDLKAGRIKDRAQIGEPIGEREFARRKYLMQQQGLYDKIYLEQ